MGVFRAYIVLFDPEMETRVILGDVLGFYAIQPYTSLKWFSSAIFSPRNDDLLTADWEIPN